MSNKPKSATAKAVDATERGMTVAKAAEKFSVSQSGIYREQRRRRRAALGRCPHCGQKMPERY